MGAVESASPSAAGIEGGNVIISLGASPVDGVDALHRVMTDGPIGTTTVTLLRRNAIMRRDITPIEARTPVVA